MMKKIMLFVAACVALVACTKNIDTKTPKGGDATTFEKGQTVTLTVNTGDQTKVTSELVTSGADKDKVNFAWETGDKIKVTVGTESAEFTLSSGAGTASAEFTGTMPAAGNTFNVQYPVDDPDLSSQTYVANGLPKDKMKMAATNCTIASGFTLNPQYAALRLNLYGVERNVSQIVVTNITSKAAPKPSYTLNISPVVTISSDKASSTPFFIVVPAGESEWGFKIEVTSEPSVTPSTYTLPKYPSSTEPNYGSGILIVNGTFSPYTKQSFTAGQVLNMPAVSLTTVWAPVNCGYDATNYKYGKLYQWGRKIGGGYYNSDAGGVFQDAIAANFDADGYNKTPADDKFYTNSTNPRDWYTNATDKQLTAWPMKSGDAGYVEGKIANPCPEGWRVPTYEEFYALWGENFEPSLTEVGGQKGCYFNGTSDASSGLFLPAAGFRNYGNGNASDRGGIGSYWLSFVNGESAIQFYFEDNWAVPSKDSRASGSSVRCVKE